MIINRITKDFEKLPDKEIEEYSMNYKSIRSSWLCDLIDELEKRNINVDRIPLIRDELSWREKVREEVLSQVVNPKNTWGLIPTLRHKTNWRISQKHLYILSMYVINVMFWDIGIGLGCRKGFILERPDGIDGKSHSKIKVKLDDFGNLKVKCIATGDVIFDKERNIRSLIFFLKAFEIIGKREGVIN